MTTRVSDQGWIAAAGELLLGAACHGCGRPWWGVCPECRAAVRAAEPRPVRPRGAPPGFPSTVAAGPYDSVLGGLIVAHKERQALLLAGVLGERLAAAVAALAGAQAGRPLVLVPVPSRPAVVRSRGYDATTTLARRAARVLDGEVAVRRWLTPARRIGDQTGLTAAARRANLAGAYRLRHGAACRPPPETARLVIVDDLVTTGSTLAEAARALGAAGLAPIGAATVAATSPFTQGRGRQPLRTG